MWIRLEDSGCDELIISSNFGLVRLGLDAGVIDQFRNANNKINDVGQLRRDVSRANNPESGTGSLGRSVESEFGSEKLGGVTSISGDLDVVGEQSNLIGVNSAEDHPLQDSVQICYFPKKKKKNKKEWQ